MHPLWRAMRMIRDARQPDRCARYRMGSSPARVGHQRLGELRSHQPMARRSPAPTCSVNHGRCGNDARSPTVRAVCGPRAHAITRSYPGGASAMALAIRPEKPRPKRAGSPGAPTAWDLRNEPITSRERVFRRPPDPCPRWRSRPGHVRESSFPDTAGGHQHAPAYRAKNQSRLRCNLSLHSFIGPRFEPRLPETNR